MSYQDQALPRPKWFSWLTDSLTVAASKAQAKLDEGRQIRDRLRKAEQNEVAIRKAFTEVEKMALDPRFVTWSQKRIRIKLLQILEGADE